MSAAVPLGDVLKRPPFMGPVPADDTRRWERRDYCERCHAAPCRCQRCHGTGYYRVDRGDERIAEVVECDCLAQRRTSQLVDEFAAISALPGLADLTFASFTERAEVAEALECARIFAEDPHGFLVLHGDVGLGKTHLAAAIGWALRARGVPVLLLVVPDLLAELRSSYAAKDAPRALRLLEGAQSAPVLILDDYGAERDTAFGLEQLYLIVDERYRRRLPLVVTTNTLMTLEARVRDRLTDDGRGVTVCLRGQSYRQLPVAYRGGAA